MAQLTRFIDLFSANIQTTREIDVETTEVELSKDDDSEISVEVEGCCHVNKK